MVAEKVMAGNVGLAHWRRQNQEWRQGLSQPKPRSKDKQLSPRKYSYVFKRLVVERRKLKQPLPLTDAFPMLVDGWKETGVWPIEYPAVGEPLFK
ncbi:hypothetical protein GGF46_005121 [Coemansia sp. RSA 552]|nr:hypothetical protein GGF46_005121 [Coemansia sp. RSA 552]